MKGFTLVEVLVVMTITVILTGLLVANFNRTSADLTQVRILIEEAIREAQTLALAGASYGDSYRCGYGVHFEERSYTIYAGPDSEVENCALFDKTYGPDADIVRVGMIANPAINILPAPDIFYEPPKPTTFIDGSSEPGSADIRIVKGDATCPSSGCRIINVTTSGLIIAK